MSKPCRTLAAVLIVALAGLAQAENWPRFRGPNGSGLAPALDIPSQWSADDFRWKTKLPGQGHSAPVIWGERLFVTSAADKGARRFVHALNTRDGKLLWTFEHPAATHRTHLRNSHASSTPAVDAERVYVCFGTPEEYLFLALDHEGREVWRRDLGPFGGGHGAGCSPVVYEEMVVLANIKPNDGYVVALDCATGIERWRMPRTEDTRPAYSTPCVFEQPGAGAVLIFTDATRGIEALDPRSGKTKWAADVFSGDGERRSISSPVVTDRLVIGVAGIAGGKRVVIAVEPDGVQPKEPPKKVYEIDRNTPQITTPLVKDDLLFMWADQGIVTCSDVADGETIWQKRVGGNFFGSPICFGDRLLAVSEEGEAIVLAASREYEELGRTSLGEPSSSTPAVAGGTLFLRTLSHVYAVGPRK